MKLSDSINQLLLALIIGVFSIAVSYMGEMSKNVQSMSVSVQELNVKMGHITLIISDHEARIRSVEKSRR
jgi:hypothetical protein